METKVTGFGRDYVWVSKIVEHSPLQHRSEATQSMEKLERRLEVIGFNLIEERKVWWEENRYLRMMSPEGRAVCAEAFFEGPSTSIRTHHSVQYRLTGLEGDVGQVIAEINGQKSEKARGCYTCR